ncbi:ABC transporter ATP-binding protein [Aliidongia dinghuensis]|uniref:ABC transporter ATP-binding protein n=1 Tax=Aliidongia dinghuensis TaxID=1867774 RepID=A0A8J2Z1E7_9PROT|nr:ABC transporter ATP-binding protein [Aliidongia dinghuensis]
MLRHLSPHLWPRHEPELRLRVLAALALIVAGKLATVAIPLIYKQAVDALSLAAQPLVLVPVALIIFYGLARVAAQAAGELRELVFAKVAQRAIRRIALEVFRHLHALSLRFHLERQTGGLSRSIERGTTGIEYLLSFTLFNIGPTLLEILLVSAILWRRYDARFMLATLATIVAYVAWTIGITQWRVRFRREMNERDGEANARAIDSLLNYETVKYFSNEAHEARRFDLAKQAFERAAVRSQTSLSLLNLGQGLIISSGLVLMMILAGAGVAQHRLTVGDFVLVNSYLLQLYQPLNILGMVYRNIKQSLIDVEAMYRLLHEPAEVEDRAGAPELVVARGGRVRFERVSFAYDPRRPILDEVSFEVPAGQTVAIVGPSGGGKSTIARLLFRFYDVTGGSIEIDGQDLRDVTQGSLRRAIGVVPQDTVLFNDTIRYNIAYGRPDASEAEIIEAARLARIHDFVARLPDGYETRVGERGLKLSGGEKQRVAIARVILKAPAILIFDEATSALDSATEQEIQASLRQVSTDHTTVVIAHRLSTVVDADEILVLDHGRIIERGRHGELLRLGGAYAAMWARQRRAAEREAALAEIAAEIQD